MKWSALLTLMLLLLSISSGVRAQDLDEKPVSHKEKKSKAAAKHVDLDDVVLDDGEATAPPKSIETTPDATKTALVQADALEKSKNFAGVIKLLKPLMDTMPRKGFLQLARAYRASGDSTNEIHALELITAKNPKDYVVQTALGDAYFKAGKIDEAGTAYQTARTLNNKYRPAYEGIWAILEKSDSKYEARTLVLDMIKVFGPDAKTTSAVCRSFTGEDFLEKAVETCRVAIETDPKNPANYVNLAESLRDEEKKDEAQKTIEDAAKVFSKSEEVQSLAGELRASDKNFADAYKYFKQAKIDDPKSIRAQLGFAKSAFELQKHGEAIESFKAACHIDRKTGREFRAAYLQLKKNKDAKATLYESEMDACQ